MQEDAERASIQVEILRLLISEFADIPPNQMTRDRFETFLFLYLNEFNCPLFKNEISDLVQILESRKNENPELPVTFGFYDLCYVTNTMFPLGTYISKHYKDSNS